MMAKHVIKDSVEVRFGFEFPIAGDLKGRAVTLQRPVGLDAPDRIDRFFVVARLRRENLASYVREELTKAGGKLAFAQPGNFALDDAIWKNIYDISPHAVFHLVLEFCRLIDLPLT
jgi:hypothetical protein